MTIQVTDQERVELREQAKLRSESNTALYDHLAKLAQDDEAKHIAARKKYPDDGYLDWDYQFCGSRQNYEWGN